MMERVLDGFEGMPEHIERDRAGLGDPVRLD
ncbi:hypothetical protein Tther_01318 [Tepidimonas thermarum]|uniref:Uncharacterized protein n=1 Tax=Tepidimonas thermarum TaxID=335431 RepID=A0A554X210_9BURK|nr:hypothetical protein Tther_01318 [Tepidimonas thermarum]